VTGTTCPSCGATASPGSLFCGDCGGELIVRCASCEATWPLVQQFCAACGNIAARLQAAALSGAVVVGERDAGNWLRHLSGDEGIALLGWVAFSDAAATALEGGDGSEPARRALAVAEQTGDRRLAERARPLAV